MNEKTSKKEFEKLNDFIKTNLKIDEYVNTNNLNLHPHVKTELLYELLESKNIHILILVKLIFYKLLKFEEHKIQIKSEIKDILKTNCFDKLIVSNLYFCIEEFDEAEKILLDVSYDEKMYINCLLETQSNFFIDNLRNNIQRVLSLGINITQLIALKYYCNKVNTRLSSLFSEDIYYDIGNLDIQIFLEIPLILKHELNTEKSIDLILKGQYNTLPNLFFSITDFQKLKILEIYKGTEWGEKMTIAFIDQRIKYLESEVFENICDEKLHEIIKYRLNVGDKQIKMHVSTALFLRYQQTGNLKYLEQSVLYFPNERNVEALALHLFKIEDFVKAEKTVDKYLKLVESVKMLYLKGCLLLQRGVECEYIFKKLSLTESDDHKVFFNLGICELRKGKFKDALISFKKSQLIKPNKSVEEIIENIFATINNYQDV